MTYEELMQWLQGAQTMTIGRDDYNAMLYNPNDVNPTFKGPGDPIWSGLQGSEAFYQAPLGYDAAPNMNRDAMWDYLNQNGQQWVTASKGNETANFIQGPDGPIASTADFTRAEDDAFKLAALAAMGITGANVLGAMGAGGAATAQGGGYVSPELVGGSFGPGSAQLGAAGSIGTLPGASSLPAITSGGVPAISNAGFGAITAPTLESLATIGGGASAVSGLLDNPLLKAATVIAGAAGGAKPSDGATTTQQSKTDPRMDPYIYGDDGVLKAYQNFYKKHKTPNANQQAGWDLKLGLLNNPATMQGLQGLMSNAQGLLGSPVAGNGWNKFYGGG